VTPSSDSVPVCAERWIVSTPAADIRICAPAPATPAKTSRSTDGRAATGIADAMTSPMPDPDAMVTFPSMRATSPPSTRTAGAGVPAAYRPGTVVESTVMVW